MVLDFSTAVLKTKKAMEYVFNILKENNLQSRILFQDGLGYAEETDDSKISNGTHLSQFSRYIGCWGPHLFLW